MDPGTYRAKVVTHSLGTSGSGTPFVAITFELASGETIQAKVYLSEKAAGIARRSLRAIAFDVDSLDLSELDENPILCAGQEADIEIVEETYRGHSFLKVKTIGRSAQRPMPSVLSKMTKALRAAKKTEDDPKDVPAAGGSPNGDDIPF